MLVDCSTGSDCTTVFCDITICFWSNSLILNGWIWSINCRCRHVYYSNNLVWYNKDTMSWRCAVTNFPKFFIYRCTEVQSARVLLATKLSLSLQEWHRGYLKKNWRLRLWSLSIPRRYQEQCRVCWNAFHVLIEGLQVFQNVWEPPENSRW